MYQIEFYETVDGKFELWDFLEQLREKAANNKDARVQYKQLGFYIQLLQDNGTRLNDNITKHLEDGIGELRPGNNRVFIFVLKVIRLCYFTIFEKISKDSKTRNRKSKERTRRLFCKKEADDR